MTDRDDDICYTHHGGNPESNAANVQTDKERDRAAILRLLDREGQLTCDQIEVALGMRHQTASARCSELLRERKVERTGEKRETRSGCKASILRIRPEEPPPAPTQPGEYQQGKLWG